MIRAVIFDMDGVLVESELVYMEMFNEFLTKQGIPHTKEFLFSLIGSSEQKTIELLDEISQPKMSGRQVMDAILKESEDNPIDYAKTLVDGVHEVMEYLKNKGYKIGLASSSSPDNILTVTKACKLDHYFDVVSSGHDFKESKPNPEIYITTMKKLGVSPDECLIVEDSSYGIAAAKAAGVYTIARKDVHFGLDQSAADVSVNDFREIITIIEDREGM